MSRAEVPRRKRRPFRKAARFLERALLGAMMTGAAFVIERRLLKAIKAGGSKEQESPPPSARVG